MAQLGTGTGLDHGRVLSNMCTGWFISRSDALLSAGRTEEYTSPTLWQDACSHIRAVQVLEGTGELRGSWKW